MELNENIKKLCEELKLPTVVEEYHTIGSKASQENWTFTQFLNELLQKEVTNRLENSKKTLTKFAGFPAIKTLEEFVPQGQASRITSLQLVLTPNKLMS